MPFPGDLPNPVIKPELEPLKSPALSGGFLTTEPPGKLLQAVYWGQFHHNRGKNVDSASPLGMEPRTECRNFYPQFQCTNQVFTEFCCGI